MLNKRCPWALMIDDLQFESLSQHTSIQTSKAFQLVAQTSSNEMTQWTLKMHEIAVKTKQETLSMHVITVFTLIFLPGTFVAVSLSLALGQCSQILTTVALRRSSAAASCAGTTTARWVPTGLCAAAASASFCPSACP